jgi:enediyne biosynthesis thioesterase
MSKSYRIDHVVSLRESNLLGNVYFSHYFEWQGRCREMFLREMCPTLIQELELGQLRIVTVRAGCDYCEEARAFDQIEIHMRLDREVAFGVRMSFEYLKPDPETGSETLVARGHQEIKFQRRSLASGEWELAPVPVKLREELAQFA